MRKVLNNTNLKKLDKNHVCTHISNLLLNYASFGLGEVFRDIGILVSG
jgi:hypothetical protein